MGGPGDSLIVLNTGVLGVGLDPLIETYASPSLCGGLSAGILDPAMSSFSSSALPSLPDDFSPGALSWFQPSPTAVRSEPLPDLLEASSEDLERLAQQGYERDLQDQVGQLLRDFPACAVHNLAANYGRLPRFLQEVWIDYADDPRVGFQIDYVMGEGGALVPQIRFVTMQDDAPVLRIDTRPTASPEFDFSDVSVAAAGMLFTRPPSSGPTGSSGRGPSLLTTNPYLGTAVTLGGATLIYVLVDRQVAEMDMPPALRGFVATGESLAIYEGLGRLGVIERPQWGTMARSTPHLALLSIGASHFYEDVFGWRRGTTENSLASFVTTTGVYVGAPRLAGRFPRLANLYRGSIGLPTSGAMAFRGSSLVSGGLRFAGAVGTVFLIDWLGGSLGEFAIWAGDGFGSPSPDARVWRTALESLYADFANNVGGFTGWSARNLPSINKASMGWARALSSDFDREFTSGVRDVIDRWVSGTNDVVEAINNGFLLCALQSMESAPDGGLRFNRETFQVHLRELFRQESDVIGAAYRMESMLRSSRWGGGITEASEIAGMVSESGYVSDQRELDSHLDALFHADYYTTRLRPMLETIIREERRAYEERLGALNLLDGQTGRPRRTSQLNQAQRDFLHGNGQTSEAATRRRRIEVLSTLLTRLNSGANLWEGNSPQ